MVGAGNILVRAEQQHTAVLGLIGLQALEHLLPVVEHHGRGLQGDGLVRDDLGVVPAMLPIIGHDVHMVGKNFTKAQLGLVRRLLLRGFCQFNFNFLHK